MNVQDRRSRYRDDHQVLAIVILLVGQAMAVMDGSILVVAAPSLHADLHASGAELQLVVAMYTLAFGALVVTGARLGEILGSGRAFVRGLAGFTVASVLGGLAPTPTVLIGARILQGASAAVMTPQVLSIIQTSFDGERRARAIGAYSMILAAGVAAGQIVGGLLVTAHLVAAAWRPALLLNAPIGAVLLLASRRRLPLNASGIGRLDLRGVALLAVSLVALIVPLTLGRQYHWPVWVWPCIGAGAVGGWLFVAHERRLSARGGNPVCDLSIFTLPGVAAGIVSVLVIMGCYAGFLLTLTLRLQGSLGFTALHAGLIFAIYAAGFAAASLTWSRVGLRIRARLPVLGPLLMGAALLGVGLIDLGGGWSTPACAPLLFTAGVGHALGFSPLANQLTESIKCTQAASLSGLILTASLIGQASGVAAFVGIYLSVSSHAPARALAITTSAIAAVLVLDAAWARGALTQSTTARGRPRAVNS